MKRLISALFTVIFLCTASHSLFAQGTTAFTYQGRLNDSGSVAGGNYDLLFVLYGGPSGGSAIGPLLTNSPTFVTNGLFAVSLDFSNNFDGTARYLEIRVRPFGNLGAYSTLIPRQQITPTPYALFASSSSNATSAATLTGSVPSGGISGSYTNIVNFTNANNSFIGFYTGNGSGLTNVPGGFLTWRIFDNTNLLALANTGYILTSTNFVTVTMPDTTNISDLLRIVDIGSGGWRILLRTNQNLFVDNIAGAIGANWGPSDSPSLPWFDIASSADGTKLIAVNGNDIYQSLDSGANWTKIKTGSTWVSAASSSDGSKLVVGAGPTLQVWTSTDSGANFIARGGNGNWVAVASSADGSRLAACNNSSGSGGLILTSTDYGTNWSNHSSSSGTRLWTSIASSADGLKLVASVTNGNIFTSVDGGTTWVSRATSQAWHGVASSSDGKKLAACVSSGQIWTSADSGVTWIARENARNWTSISSSSDGDKLVATVFNGGIYASGDSGFSWTTHAPTNNWWTVSSSSDGTTMAAGIRTGLIYVSSGTVNVTVNGYLTGGQGAAVELLSVGLGQWVPISFMGQIFAY